MIKGNRVTHSIYTSHYLSPATSVIDQWAKNKVVMVAGLEIVHGFSSTDFHSPRPTWLWPPLSTQSATSKDHY